MYIKKNREMTVNPAIFINKNGHLAQIISIKPNKCSFLQFPPQYQSITGILIPT